MLLAITKRVKRLHKGLDTWPEAFIVVAEKILKKLSVVSVEKLYRKIHAKRMKKKLFCTNDRLYHIKDVRLPAIVNPEDESAFLRAAFEDTFASYFYFNDSYDEAIVDCCDIMLGEGLYGLANDKVNVVVNPGDIVIDAGAWIGDFAAYASMKGATVYAFEPANSTFKILLKTAELNENIIPVKKGLSNNSEMRKFFPVVIGNTGRNSFMTGNDNPDNAENAYQVETVRLDDFVRENNIPRVDFIKFDIEGFERHMLEGAQETLARFAPKLALCTYHLPDDPQVMEALIKKANPKYNVVQKRHKLYASVPQE